MLCFFVQCEKETSKTVSLSTGKLKKLPFFIYCRVKQHISKAFYIKTLFIKNWMRSEFENCLMQDFEVADVGLSLWRMIHMYRIIQINYH